MLANRKAFCASFICHICQSLLVECFYCRLNNIHNFLIFSRFTEENKQIFRVSHNNHFMLSSLMIYISRLKRISDLGYYRPDLHNIKILHWFDTIFYAFNKYIAHIFDISVQCVVKIIITPWAISPWRSVIFPRALQSNVVTNLLN